MAMDPLWWSSPGHFDVRDGRLHIAGRDAAAIAREHGTPLYVYDLRRIEEQVRELQGAFLRAGFDDARVRLALKAQRDEEVLAFIRALGEPGTPEAVGMDVCSPGEVTHALASGWQPEEISYTGTNVSERDLDVILAHPIHLNVDLLTQLDRVGRRDPGRRIGFRINPQAGAGYDGGDSTLYARADRPTKFGIFADQLDQALEIAARHELTIDTVHFHAGDGFLTDGIPRYERAVERAAEIARRLQEAGSPIEEVNVGGGLGVPHKAEDQPLDVDALAQMLAKHLLPLGVRVAIEPGDFLVKESAALLAEVVTVEERQGVTFVGVDAGWNLLNDRFIYDGRQEVVVCERADAPPAGEVTVGGHINEGDDLFVEDRALPQVREGDILALLGCGSYAQSMTIIHCLRPPAPSEAFGERAEGPREA